MASKIKLPFTLLLFLALLMSCAKDSGANPTAGFESTSTPITSDREKAFTEMFTAEQMNTKIRFWPPHEIFKKGDCPYLGLENLSGQKIIFPSDYGLHILTYAANQWKDISNTAQYVPPGNPQVSPKGTDLPGIIAIPFCPDLANFQTPIEIRIVVTGKTEPANNTGSIQVGAFIDMVIEK